MADEVWGDELPLNTVESFIAALVEAGPEVAEHMVKAANELLLAAQAITVAAERRLAEQRRLREEAETRTASAQADVRPAGAADPAGDGAQGPVLRRVGEVA